MMTIREQVHMAVELELSDLRCDNDALWAIVQHACDLIAETEQQQKLYDALIIRLQDTIAEQRQTIVELDPPVMISIPMPEVLRDEP